MKKLALLSLALATIISPASAQQSRSNSQAAPNAVEAIDQTSSAPASVDAGPKATAQDLATLGSSEPAKAEHWKDLDNTTQYLLIMGTADGFSAAGAGSPCFPGQDNAKLNASLKAAGFGDKDPVTLADALAKLSAPKDQCEHSPKRGYTTDLLKSMTDEHLSIYLSGVVRGYSKVKECPADNHGYAAATIATDLFALQAPKDPVDLIRPAVVNGCAFKPS